MWNRCAANLSKEIVHSSGRKKRREAGVVDHRKINDDWDYSVEACAVAIIRGLLPVHCVVTIISRNSGTPKADLRLLWSYRERLTGDPNWKKDVVQNIQNIAFFIPFGALLPVKNWKAVLITAVVFSGLIEVVQYIGGFGLAEIDDVICNTLGAMFGFWIYAELKKVRSKLTGEGMRCE